MDYRHSDFRPASFYTHHHQQQQQQQRHPSVPHTRSSPAAPVYHDCTQKPTIRQYNNKNKPRWVWSALFRRRQRDGCHQAGLESEDDGARSSPSPVICRPTIQPCQRLLPPSPAESGTGDFQQKRRQARLRVEARRSQVYSSDDDESPLSRRLAPQSSPREEQRVGLPPIIDESPRRPTHHGKSTIEWQMLNGRSYRHTSSLPAGVTFSDGAHSAMSSVGHTIRLPVSQELSSPAPQILSAEEIAQRGNNCYADASSKYHSTSPACSYNKLTAHSAHVSDHGYSTPAQYTASVTLSTVKYNRSSNTRLPGDRHVSMSYPNHPSQSSERTFQSPPSYEQAIRQHPAKFHAFCRGDSPIINQSPRIPTPDQIQHFSIGKGGKTPFPVDCLSSSDQSIAVYKRTLFEKSRGMTENDHPAPTVCSERCESMVNSHCTSQDSAFLSDCQQTTCTLDTRSRSQKQVDESAHPSDQNHLNFTGSVPEAFSQKGSVLKRNRIPSPGNWSSARAPHTPMLSSAKSCDDVPSSMLHFSACPESPDSALDLSRSAESAVTPSDTPTTPLPHERCRTTSGQLNKDTRTTVGRRKEHGRALCELEALYGQLCEQLNDEDLLDRAERRDLPTHHQLMWRASIDCPGASSEAGHDRSSGVPNHCGRQRHTPVLRRTAVSNRANDDLYQRRFARASSEQKCTQRDIMSRTGSYLLLSPVFSTSMDTLDDSRRSIVGDSEPDITLDDVTFRSNRRSNVICVADPQPPFGIPLSPAMPVVSQSNYLYTSAPKDGPRWHCQPRRRPHKHLDDMAYRSLRRDCRSLSPPRALLSYFSSSGSPRASRAHRIHYCRAPDKASSAEDDALARREVLKSSRRPNGRAQTMCFCGQHTVSDSEADCVDYVPTSVQKPATSPIPFSSRPGALYQLFVYEASNCASPVSTVGIDSLFCQDITIDRPIYTRVDLFHSRPFYERFSAPGADQRDWTLSRKTLNNSQLASLGHSLASSDECVWMVEPPIDIDPNRWQLPNIDSEQTLMAFVTHGPIKKNCLCLDVTSTQKSANDYNSELSVNLDQTKPTWCSSMLSSTPKSQTISASGNISTCSRENEDFLPSTEDNSIPMKHDFDERVMEVSGVRSRKHDSATHVCDSVDDKSGPNMKSIDSLMEGAGGEDSHDPAEVSTMDTSLQIHSHPRSAGSRLDPRIVVECTANSDLVRGHTVSSSGLSSRSPSTTPSVPVARDDGLKGETLSRVWTLAMVCICVLQLFGTGVVPALFLLMALLTVLLALVC